MSTSNSQLGQIKKIVRRWSMHVIYVFVAIVIVFFNLSFAEIVKEQSIDPELNGYLKLLEQFLKALPVAAKPIAFLLIFIFLCLMFYSTYIMIRVSRRIFQSFWRAIQSFLLLFLPMLLNCIFMLLIGLIANHCLQRSINGSLILSVCHNFLFQLGIIMPIVILNIYRDNLKINKIIGSILLLILLVISLTSLIWLLYYNKAVWSYETFYYAIKYFSSDNYPRLKEIINFAVNKSMYWSAPLVLYFFGIWYILTRPFESEND